MDNPGTQASSVTGTQASSVTIHRHHRGQGHRYHWLQGHRHHRSQGHRHHRLQGHRHHRSQYTGIIGHNTQNGDKQRKNTETKKDETHQKKPGTNPGAREG